MLKKITIAIDAMGGDNSPDKVINGVYLFLKKNNNKKDFVINLFGDEKKINEKLKKYKISSNYVIVTHTSSIVSDEETPITAVKNSKYKYVELYKVTNRRKLRHKFICGKYWCSIGSLKNDIKNDGGSFKTCISRIVAE